MEALDELLVAISRRARLLPALVPENVVTERARLLSALERGEPTEPRWVFQHVAPPRSVMSALERARVLASSAEHELVGTAYLERLEELELDLHLLAALADPHGNQRARALGRRRFGTASQLVLGRSLLATAQAWIEELGPVQDEPRSMNADGPGSLGEAMRRAARATGIEVEVRVEPRLIAGAAAGDRTLFVADRRFGAREARRLVAHEVLGHAVAAHNGRGWPLALFAAGSAGSFAHQEGLALVLEERAGAFDAERRRTLALRVIAAAWVNDGASFVDVARRLMEGHGLGARATLPLAERACRGNGVAREVAYLAGYLEVRAALDEGLALSAIRAGRISLALARALPRFAAVGIEARGAIDPQVDEVLHEAFG